MEGLLAAMGGDGGKKFLFSSAFYQHFLGEGGEGGDQMRQYMALMQQAMGMQGMNGSSSRQQKFLEI